jgi:hypothetical protein
MPSRVPPHMSRRRRSPYEWASRVALASGAAVLGCYSVVFSVAQVTAGTDPALANRLASYDGRLLAAQAGALITPSAGVAARAKAKALARSALDHDPTAVVAAATLGIAAATEEKAVEAQRFLAYAQMLSRRNTQTQLWSIEDAVARNDVADALHWYDIALRTNPSLGNILYPVLAQAAQNSAIRSKLVRTLVGKPIWADNYINYVVQQRNDPRSTATLFLELRLHGVVVPEPARAAVVNALLEGGQADEAWRYYVTLHPGADRRRSRDPRFTAPPTTASLLDWIPVNDGNVSASIQRAGDGGTFEFSAPATIGGAVLQQIQLLPPGMYRLAGHSDGIAQEARALPYWTLSCRSDGRELGRVILPNSAQAGGTFAGSLTVPANCPVQALMLFAPPSDATGGTSGQINRVTLLPAG